MRVLFVYALLKVVGHYDFSVLSLSAMGFQKKLDRTELSPVFVWDFFVNFTKPLRQ